jgi:hypothetical protein
MNIETPLSEREGLPLHNGEEEGLPFLKVEFRCSRFLEQPHDGHNRPKLVPKKTQNKEIKTELAVTDFL